MRKIPRAERAIIKGEICRLRGGKGLLLKRNTAALAFGGGCGVVFAAEWADHGIPPL